MYYQRLKNLTISLFRIRIYRLKEFKFDSVVGLVTDLFYLAANLVFWMFIFNSSYSIEGWDIHYIFVFLAYSELFYGLDSSIFSIASRFWLYVVTGTLDTFLVRPMDPRIRIVLLNVNFIGIIKSIVVFTILLILSGVDMNIFIILLGVVIVIVSNFVLMLIRLVLSYLSFKFGRVDAVTELTDSLVMFNKYPLTILPKSLIVIFKLVLPFFFFSTFSAIINIESSFSFDSMYSIIMLLGCLVFWVIINKVFWKWGLSRYESYNG